MNNLTKQLTKTDIHKLLDGYKRFLYLKQNTKFIIPKNDVYIYLSERDIENLVEYIKTKGYKNFNFLDLLDEEKKNKIKGHFLKIINENEEENKKQKLAIAFPVFEIKEKKSFYVPLIFPLSYDNNIVKVEPGEENKNFNELMKQRKDVDFSSKEQDKFSNDNIVLLKNIFDLCLSVGTCVISVPPPLNFMISLYTSRECIKNLYNKISNSHKMVPEKKTLLTQISNNIGFIFVYQESDSLDKIFNDIKEIEKEVTEKNIHKFLSLSNPSSLQHSNLQKEDILFKYRWFFPENDLTESQQTNYARICDKTQSITLIEGPPGTGKTNLIATYCIDSITHSLLQQFNGSEESEHSVLITSTNNKAVDNVINKLIEFDLFLENKYGLLTGKYLSGYARLGSNEYIEQFKESIKKILSETFSQDKIKENKNQLYEEINELTTFIKNYKNKFLKLKEHRREIEDKSLELENKKNEFSHALKLAKDMEDSLFINKNSANQFSEENLKTLLSLFVSLSRWYSYLPILSSYLKNKIFRFAVEKGLRLSGIEDFKFISCKNIYERNKKILQDYNELIKAKNNLKESKEYIEKIQITLNNLFTEAKKIEDEIVSEKNIYKESCGRLILRLKEWHYWNLQENNNFKDKLIDFINGKNTWTGGLFKYILRFAPIAISTALSIRSIFPPKQDIFDTTIVDEGSQTLWCYTIPAYYRSKKLCVIGDEYQLEPVLEKVEDNELDEIFNTLPTYLHYKNSAIETVKAIDNTDPILRRLREHFRCQPPIIEFCDNLVGYGLIIKTEYQKYKFLNVLPNNLKIIFKNPLYFEDIKGSETQKEGSWENYQEANFIKNFILSLKNFIHLSDIAILSPYRSQCKLIKKLLSNDNITIGTIHKLQGNEKEIVILSTVRTSPKSFVNNPLFQLENINVAVSRAKKHLILVSNRDALEGIPNKDDPLYKLYLYIKDWQDKEKSYYDI